MPTTSPGLMLSGTILSSDSSTRMGAPADSGVAAASTNSHRGVMTAVPNELSLGLTRWTLITPAFRRPNARGRRRAIEADPNRGETQLRRHGFLRTLAFSYLQHRRE